MSKQKKSRESAESGGGGSQNQQAASIVSEVQNQVTEARDKQKTTESKDDYNSDSQNSQIQIPPLVAKPNDPLLVQVKVEPNQPAQNLPDTNAKPASPHIDHRVDQTLAKPDAVPKPGLPNSPISGGSDSAPAVQPPPNQIVPPANPTPSRQLEQPQTPLPSNRTVEAPPLANPPAAQRSPIAGPPPSDVPNPAPNVIPGAPAGQGVLEAKITYSGSPQQVEKAADNRQAVPVDGAANQKDAIRDRFVAPENVVKSGDKSYNAPFVAEDGKTYRIVSPSPAPGMGHAALSASGNALLVTNQKQREQYQQDVAKYGQQEAMRRLEEEQKRVASGSRSDRSPHESTIESKTPRSDQAPESKGPKSEASTTDGKSAKSDPVTSESKGTKVESGDSKSGKPEGTQAEGKSQKGEAGTRPGDHAPSAGKIAEVSPEGTRSGDIDRTGKVVDVSGGSKSGDVPPQKLTDGKASDVPTNKGPEIGLVGKTGESGGKGPDASDKSQDARGTGSTDRRGGADSKVPESKTESGLAGGDRGGGLGTGWKGEQGSTPPKGQTAKEGPSERVGEEPNRSKRSGKEPSEQQGQDKTGGANKPESGSNAEKGKQGTGKGTAPTDGEPTIKGGIKVDKGDAQADAATAKGATKGGAGPKGKSAEPSTSDPRTEVTKPPPRVAGDSKTPTITDGKGTGLAPTIKGGGIPGVSMPDWLVKPDSKKSTKGSKGKGESERPDQTQQTKAISKETELAERKPPVDAEPKDKIEKPRVDLLLPGKSRKDPGAFVQDRSQKQKQPSGKDGKSGKDTPQKKDELDQKESKQTHPEQNQRTVREDAMLNQPTRKVPMQLAGRDTVPLPAIGRGAEKVAEKPQEKATPPAANLMGNRDAVMSLLLGKGKGGSEKGDHEPDSTKQIEEEQTVEAKSALPPTGTISGVLGGSKKVSRRWQASESGTFKLSSSDSLNAMRTDAMLPSERLTQSDSPRKSSLNWIRDQYAAKRELQSKQRRQYISQPGDHLGLIAVKTVGRTSPALERLLLQLNPHLEVRRQYSAEHNTDVSYLEPGSIVSLPTLDEVRLAP